MTATIKRRDELRVAVSADTPTEGITTAESALRAEGFVPTWVALSRYLSDGQWRVTVCGSRKAGEDKT